MENSIFDGHVAKKIDKIDRDLVVKAYKKIGLDVRSYLVDDVYLFKCKYSKLRFFAPFENMGGAEFYELLTESSEYYSLRWEHQKTLELLRDRKKIKKIFELGCGSGLFLENLPKNIEKWGFDFNPRVRDEIERKGVNFISLNDIDDLSKEMDVVCSFQVLEHLTDLEHTLRTFRKILKVGGLLIIGVPNNNPFLFKRDKYHALNLPPHHGILWDKKSLKKVMKMFGFRLQDIQYEPLKLYQHYCQVNLEYYLGRRIGNKLSAILLRKFSRLTIWFLKKCKGRNILAVFIKE